MTTAALIDKRALLAEAARELARRDLVEFASRVPVPGSPSAEADETSRIPLIETQQAAHHKLILREMQWCMSTPHGRLMVLAPPGSAKSTYASVVAPSWYLGMNPGKKVILASYGSDLARRHGRRTRQLLRASETQAIVQADLSPDSQAADEFSLTNGSEYIACGLLSGVTGNRANGIVIDDPIKGRDQAESEVIRKRSFEAYEDDLLTRLIPGGWIVLITTRWHEDDPAGRILPEGWSGESGDIKCRDGNVWRVVCLQAECTDARSDPMGRKVGEMLWPDWFDSRHWAQFRLNRRTWSSLYQQIPAPAEGSLFRRDDMAIYDRAHDGLRIIGASDYAATPDGGDWTEHGIAGIAADGTVYLLDWWRGQTGPEVWMERQIDMIVRWRPLAWVGETGPIRRSVEGMLRQRMIQRHAMCRLEWMSSAGGDKPMRAQAIIATAGMGRLLWPRAVAWVAELQRQCLVFPNGTPDDGVDTLGLIGRGVDIVGGAETGGAYSEPPPPDWRM